MFGCIPSVSTRSVAISILFCLYSTCITDTNNELHAVRFELPHSVLVFGFCDPYSCAVLGPYQWASHYCSVKTVPPNTLLHCWADNVASS